MTKHGLYARSSEKESILVKVKERSRTLRPSTRKDESPYKVDSKGVDHDDILRLTLLEEDNPDKILAVFEFRGRDVSERASIHFTADRIDDQWQLRFTEALPFAVTLGD